MKVFAPGAYRWGNKGDAALVVAFIEWLRSDFGATSIELTSFTPVDDAKRYGVPVHPMIVRPLHPVNRALQQAAKLHPAIRRAVTGLRMRHVDRVSGKLARWVEAHRSGGLAARRVPLRVRNLITTIEASDVVVSVPGGYLLAPKNSDDWWLAHIPTFELASLLGKPIALGPCSIGPFADGHIDHAKRLLTIPDVILLREERSAAIIAPLIDRPERVVSSPDLAFNHSPDTISALGASELRRLDQDAASHPLVGVSVRAHHFPGFPDPGAMFDEYLSAVADSLEAIQRESDATIWIFSQTEEDVPVSNQLLARLNRSGARVEVADPSLSPSDLQTMYGRLTLLLGTRMHANILALCMGTPVVGIAYEPKTLGILDSIGLSDWGVWIHEVSDGRLERLSIERWSHAADAREQALDAIRLKRSELAVVAEETVRRLESVPA